jgi:hypothetical protein
VLFRSYDVEVEVGVKQVQGYRFKVQDFRKGPETRNVFGESGVALV